MNDPALPLVTVIVPVYNVESYVSECLDSILGQSYTHLEIILVEDCSTDGSLGELQRHLADRRVRLIRHENNAGLSAARNSGIEAATGDYVMFVDSDDVMARGLVAACVTQAAATGADVLGYDCQPFQDGDCIPELIMTSASIGATRLARSDYFRLPHFAWLKFIRSELLRDPRLRFPVGLCYEDWPFHWQLGFSAGVLTHMSGAWLGYRQRATSITGSVGRKLLDQFTVQAKVLAMVREFGDAEDGAVLADKVYQGFWSVLMRIERKLLNEAVDLARSLRSELRGASLRPAPSLRSRVMDVILVCPSGLAVFAIRLLRSGRKLIRLPWRGSPTVSGGALH